MKLIVIIAALFLSSCSTYSKKQCENFDWHRLGYDSARRGDTDHEVLTHYSRECRHEHGVEVDSVRFTSGFQEGIKYLCSEEGARLLGQSGAIYKGTCPKTFEETFVKSYHSGRKDYLEHRVQELEKEVSELEDKVRQRDSKISELEAKISHLQSHNPR